MVLHSPGAILIIVSNPLDAEEKKLLDNSASEVRSLMDVLDSMKLF